MAKNYKTNQYDSKDNKDTELLSIIKENFRVASGVYSQQRQEASEDFRFRAGDQWPQNVRNQRERDGRPCLTINKLAQFIRQVVNSQKINRPSINVNPGDSQAKIEVAKVLQAIIKNIEFQSFAENAYDTAFDNACTGGEGYFRIITEYSNPMGFEQDIYIKAIDNPFSVFIDPNFKSDFTDIEWAFIFDEIPKEEYERLYPDSEYCQNSGLFNYDEWITENNVRIAEYFYIKYEPIKIVQLNNGEILLKTDYNKLPEKTRNATKIVRERESHKKVVKWVKTNGHEILEETDFPGTNIPIIPVFADSYIVDGKRVFEGVIRQAKDAQQAYNFWYNAETEQIALAPRAPFIGVEGQFEGHEAEWANANNMSLPYLEYKPVSAGGQQAPAPMRTQFDPQITSILNAKQAANEDLKATTGIYDPSLGTDKKEASGRALISKQRQAEVTNFMYIDNLCKSLKYAGRILLDIIPIIYDTERVVRIRGSINQEDELIIVNQFNEKNEIFLDLGKYDCDVSIGPYGENQRQDALDSMLSLMQIDPNLVSIMGDIFVGKQDWDGAKEISERLKIMLPQPLQDNQGIEGLPPEIQGQIKQQQMQYEQQIQQLTMQTQAMQQLIADTTAKANSAEADLNNKQAEIESRERIEALKARTQLLVAGIKEDAADSRLAFNQELAWTSAKQDGASMIPKPKDQLVLSGVNDPITEANQEEQGELTQEEEQALLAKLNNITSQV